MYNQRSKFNDYHIAGCFQGWNFSQIGLFQLYKGENFMNCQEDLVIHFKGKTFANGDWFAKSLYIIVRPCMIIHIWTTIFKQPYLKKSITN